jgi:hypothetical protein
MTADRIGPICQKILKEDIAKYDRIRSDMGISIRPRIPSECDLPRFIRQIPGPARKGTLKHRQSHGISLTRDSQWKFTQFPEARRLRDEARETAESELERRNRSRVQCITVNPRGEAAGSIAQGRDPTRCLGGRFPTRLKVIEKAETLPFSVNFQRGGGSTMRREKPPKVSWKRRNSE